VQRDEKGTNPNVVVFSLATDDVKVFPWHPLSEIINVLAKPAKKKVLAKPAKKKSSLRKISAVLCVQLCGLCVKLLTFSQSPIRNKNKNVSF
jgi:hypothetical protein